MDCDQVSGDLLGPETGGDGCRAQKHALEGNRAQAKVARSRQLADDALAVRSQRDALTKQSLQKECGRDRLSDHVRVGRTFEAHVEAVDEEWR